MNSVVSLDCYLPHHQHKLSSLIGIPWVSDDATPHTRPSCCSQSSFMMLQLSPAHFDCHETHCSKCPNYLLLTNKPKTVICTNLWTLLILTASHKDRVQWCFVVPNNIFLSVIISHGFGKFIGSSLHKQVSCELLFYTVFFTQLEKHKTGGKYF